MIITVGFNLRISIFVFFGPNIFLVLRCREGIIVFCLRCRSESIPLAGAWFWTGVGTAARIRRLMNKDFDTVNDVFVIYTHC